MEETQLEEGWIKHVPGDPPPVSSNDPIELLDRTRVLTICEDGYEGYADFWSAEYSNPIIAWRPLAVKADAEPKPLELTLTETQINAFINLLSAAEMAYREENSYWQDQDESEDNHRPDWLHQVDQALLGIDTNFPDLNLDGEAGIWTKADY